MSSRIITLKNFIQKEGRRRLCKKLKVSITTVVSWDKGEVLPKAETMLQIKRMTKGALTIDKMVEDYFKVASNREKYSFKFKQQF